MAKKKTITVKKIYPHIEYAGSVVQQNYGEDTDKGFLIWNLPTKSTTFIKLNNDLEYHTIDVIDGQIPVNLDITAKNPRIRVKFYDTNASDITKILSVIRKTYSPTELTPIKVKTTNTSLDDTKQNTLGVGDVRNVTYQNKLIFKYISDKYAVGDIILERIKDKNEDFNRQITDKDFIRNVSWKPKKFEFSNMFSYGENNVFDFTNMKGMYGLFGANSSGKSSVFDAVTYCMFDKCARAFRGYDVLNNKTDSFRCKFNFTIHNKDFFIERVGIKKFNKQTNKYTAKVDVNFWTIGDNGEIIDLNGIDRDDTNAIIKTYIGTYDDFILTALSIQNKYMGFIEMGQSERKDLLVKFLDLEIFDILYKKGAVEIKDIVGALKEHKKADYPKLLVDCDNDYSENKIEFDSFKEQKELLTKESETFRIDILQLAKKLYPIDKNIIHMSILEKQKERVDVDIEKINTEKKQHHQIINTCKQYLSDVLLKKYIKDNKDLDSKYTEYQEKKILKSNIQTDINLLKVEVSNKLSKLDHLQEHEYDENCNYCMNNVFVKDAIKTKLELKDDKIRADGHLKRLSDLENDISLYGDIENDYSEYMRILNNIDMTKNKQISFENKILNLENQLIKFQNELNIIAENKKKYEKNITNIKYNEKIQIKIDELTSTLNQINSNLSNVTNRVNFFDSQLQILDHTKKTIIQNIERLQQLEIDNEAYQYYLEAVNTNGIPYELIVEVIPNIETEVNNILTQIVDFTLNIDLDGKNVNVRIVQDEDNQWLLELGGGMEKFVSSVAIRTALVNASNLPRSNFLVIDEGFSNVDSDVINQMPMLFDYLKTQFEFIVCISHNAFVKDMVDNIINVNKDNNVSSINYIG